MPSRFLSLLLSLGVFLGGGIGCQRSRTFEGKLLYKPSLIGQGSEALQPLLQAQDLSFTLYHQGDKARIDRSDGILLIDYSADSFYVLFPEKRSYESFPLRRKDDSLPTPSVKDLSEEKEILGYRCQARRAYLPSQGDSVYMTFWEAEELIAPEPARKAYPILPRGIQIKGIPLLLQSPLPGMPISLQYEAAEIVRTPLSDTLFSIPPTYQKSN